MPDPEFDAVVRAGLISAAADPASPLEPMSYEGFGEPPAAFERPLVERLSLRPFREAAFANQVKIAYGDRCALTGLSLRNGGGRAEVQAAHIRPVAQDGPDTVRNGLALSGTAHWMFDRGLVSVADDGEILIAEGKVPADAIQRLILPECRLLMPTDPRSVPHPVYLRYHREHIFGRSA